MDSATETTIATANVFIKVYNSSSPPGTEVNAFTPSEHFVSTKVQKILEIALYFCLSFAISVIGVFTNAIVLIVFAKQGYKNSMNISMSVIAVWDLVKCLAGVTKGIAGPLWATDQALAQSWTNVCDVAFNYLISFSCYVSSALAAYVAVERCVCVTLPFKVKDILTPKVTFVACSLISLVVFGSLVVVWAIYDVVQVHHPQHNRTIFIYRYNDFFYRHRDRLFIYYNMTGIIYPVVSFVVISVCTGIIVVQLQRSSDFKRTELDQTLSEKSDNASSRLTARDRQVVKMLLVIIVLYIVNLSPRIALYLAKYFIYEFYFLRLYHNLFLVTCYVVFVFDFANGAVNLFVFLLMSSGFRATFISRFSICLYTEQNPGNKIK